MDLIMNGWQFIDHLVGHIIAWPVIVALAVWKFHRPIERLLDRVVHVNVPGVDLALGDAAKSVVLASPEAGLSASLADKAASTSKIESGTDVPRSAIGSRSLDIINREWSAVVGQIDKLIQTRTNVDPSSLTTQNKIIHLLRNNIINEAEFEAITSLMHAWRVANLYEDSMPVTVDKAYEFGAIATANNHILSSKMTVPTQGQ